MIGNDVVDLHLARTQSNWQRKGFLAKQFTQEEQHIILNSEDPFTQVWLFWSMKEATYKCYVQEHQKRFFSPKKFSCKKISKTKGLVIFKKLKYTINFNISNSYVYSVAKKEKTAKMVLESFFSVKNESSAKIIQEKMQRLFQDKIELKKNEIGIPYVYQNNQKLPFAVSKTHHGNYVGFVMAPSI